ncbi:MAG: hypothetical protein IPJ39_20360 [Saprospiraceae bacterium]|nr:hypothetical protein [Saprospiraceae bacterium]
MIVNTDQYPIMVSDTASYDIDECDYTDNVFILPAPQFTQTKKSISARVTLTTSMEIRLVLMEFILLRK